MKYFGLKMRVIAPLVVVCCLIGVASQPAQAQTGETVYVTNFSGAQVVKAVDDGTGTTVTVLNTASGEKPEDIVVGPDGKIYICDSNQNKIRRITQDGVTVEVVYDRSLNSNSTTGCAGGPCPTGPEGPSFSTTGDLYFNTRGAPATHTGVWKITSAQLSGSLPVTPTNVLTAAQTGSTFGEATMFDLKDNLLVVDSTGNRVLQSAPPYTSATAIITSGLNGPIGIAVSNVGDIFVANDFGTNIVHYGPNGGSQIEVYASFTDPAFYLQFDASNHLYVVTSVDTDPGTGKLWRVDSPGGSANTHLVVDFAGKGLANIHMVGLALPATTFTTGQQAVSPGTTTTFTNGNIINQAVQIPPDAVMNGVATMEMIFMQFAPGVFNSTRLTGTAGNTWSGGNTGPFTSANTACTAIAGTGGNCMVMEGKCFDSSGMALATCNIQHVTSLIQLTSHYKTQSSQCNPGLLIADDGQNNWADIADGYDPSDPTITGGTKGTQMDTAIVNHSCTLTADTTPPTVTATTFPLPNGAGWNNTSPVNAVITATDDQLVNNITYSTTGAQVIGSTKVLNASTFFPITNQGSTTVSFSATDNAPLTTNGTPLTVKIDTTPPSISITSPTSGATYTLNQAQAAGYTCTDPIPTGVTLVSGVASCAGPVANLANIDTASVGSKTFTVNSTDVAGNAATKSVNYSVLYQSAGTTCFGDAGHQILQPINADGTSVYNQGRTVPAKFRVCDANGVSIGTAGVVSSFQLTATVTGTVTTPVQNVVDTSNPDTSFRWDPTGQQWIFNITTKNLAAGSTYVYTITLNDGSTIVFQFGLR